MSMKDESSNTLESSLELAVRFMLCLFAAVPINVFFDVFAWALEEAIGFVVNPYLLSYGFKFPTACFVAAVILGVFKKDKGEGSNNNVDDNADKPIN